MFFLLFLRILKVVRTGYFVIYFVTRFFKSPTLLKPALYTVVLNFKKIFPKNFPKKLGGVTSLLSDCFFHNLKIAKLI